MQASANTFTTTYLDPSCVKDDIMMSLVQLFRD